MKSYGLDAFLFKDGPYDVYWVGQAMKGYTKLLKNYCGVLCIAVVLFQSKVTSLAGFSLLGTMFVSISTQARYGCILCDKCGSV